MIAVIDYGVGNLSSVINMFRKIGAEAVVTKNPNEILLADKVLLPGVGHFDFGMKMLNKSGLRDVLDKFAMDHKKPVLGICLGAQILGRGSEEGKEAGLGWVDMECLRLPAMPGLKVPHMGWSHIEIKQDSELFPDFDPITRFYFVHSYYMSCASIDNVIATSVHGIEFTSVVRRENIFGTQFHPEKSLRHGFALMRAFAEFTSHE